MLQIYLITYVLLVEARRKTHLARVARTGGSNSRVPRRQVARGDDLLVHLCGTFPRRYIHLGHYDCGVGPYDQEDVECDQGECCTLPPNQQIMAWDTCDNGGYFISAPCSSSAQGECCTRPEDGLDEDDYDDQGSSEYEDESPAVPDSYTSSEWNVDCANQGYYLNKSCDRDAACNRVRDLYLASNEQVACISGSCCVMPRRLPTGARSWMDVCPSGGNYLGAFCDQDQDCGVDPNQSRICELQRYCCTDPDYTTEEEENALPRPPRANSLQSEDEEMCDEPTDRPTQTPCSTDFHCASYDDEYCGGEDSAAYLKVEVVKFLMCLEVDRRWSYHRALALTEAELLGFVVVWMWTVTGGLQPPPVVNPVIAPQLEEPESSIDDQQEIGLNGNEIEEGDGGIQQPISTYGVIRLCYNRQRSRVRCTSQDRCKSNQSCINGLCCTRTGDEWQNACGGTTAQSSCFADRTCQNQMFCTSSAFCCECPYGQAAGKCASGCHPDYKCELNGYCCPKCPGGQLPYGSCYNNQCADNHFCHKGNICCPL
uniref:Uncharacterized protein n=1 Tax=Ditylenchus dipsaci TaxID=166011 RepID=A0A915DD85_9BILA